MEPFNLKFLIWSFLELFHWWLAHLHFLCSLFLELLSFRWWISTDSLIFLWFLSYFENLFKSLLHILENFLNLYYNSSIEFLTDVTKVFFILFPRVLYWSPNVPFSVTYCSCSMVAISSLILPRMFTSVDIFFSLVVYVSSKLPLIFILVSIFHARGFAQMHGNH